MRKLATAGALAAYTAHVARDPHKASASVQKAAARVAKKADRETEAIKAKRRQTA
jgi:hypothetical protein